MISNGEERVKQRYSSEESTGFLKNPRAKRNELVRKSVKFQGVSFGSH